MAGSQDPISPPSSGAQREANATLWMGLKGIYAHLSPARRRQLYLLLFLMLLGAVAELATIGAIIPFLAFLADPESLARLPWPISILGEASIETGHALISTGLLFGLFVMGAGLIRLQLAWLTQSFVFRLAHEVRPQEL